MNLIINHSSMQPIYEQIIGQIKEKIMHGELQEDTMLPSVRTLAKELKVSALTVKKAINGGISLPIEKAVEVEEKLFGDCFETHDQVEGMSCFLSREKPKPKAVFTNN